MFGTDIRISGGDRHDKGWYQHLTDLQAGYPVGNPGDFATIGDTDTIWVWNVSTSTWTNTGYVPTALTKVYTVGPTGCNYTVIQNALNAHHLGSELFIVYPGTYAGDSIYFTANNQCVRGLSCKQLDVSIIGTDLVKVTSVSTTIVDAGIFTGCLVMDVESIITGATSAIPVVTVSTGTLVMERCIVKMTNGSVTTEPQPVAISVTGAGYIEMLRGYTYYDNDLADIDGLTAIKACIRVVAGGIIDLNNAEHFITGSQQSLASTLCYGAGEVRTRLCRVSVIDPDTTFCVGYYMNGNATGILFRNRFDVEGGIVSGGAVGLWLEDNASFRSDYNYYKITTSAIGAHAIGFLTTSGTTALTSQFDDIIAVNGTSAAGVFKMVSSTADGHLTTTDGLALLNLNTGGLVKATLLTGELTLATAEADYVTPTGTGTLSNKILDSSCTEYSTSINDWNNIAVTSSTASTSLSCGTVVFPGTYVDALKYNRSLFRCKTDIGSGATLVTVTGVSNTGLELTHNINGIPTAHGHRTGDIVFFTNSSLVTVLQNVPYYIIWTGTNTYKLAASISDAIAGTPVIAYNNAGVNVSPKYVMHGYVDNATYSAGNVTLSVAVDYDLTNTYTNYTDYQLTRIRKIYDFQEYINTGYTGVSADTVKPQGRMILDTPRALYLQPVNSALGIAATGAGVCQWWVGKGVAGAVPTSTMFASTTTQNISNTNTVANYCRPDYVQAGTGIFGKLIPASYNIGCFIQAVGGTTVGSKLQWRLFLVPVDIIAL